MFFSAQGELLYSESPVNFKRIPEIKVSPHYNDFFLTLDIETFIHNNEHIPYAIGFYDGVNSPSLFYLSDFESPQALILACFNQLLIRKYNNKVVYVHNLGGFDSVFLINSLLPHYNLKPV